MKKTYRSPWAWIPSLYLAEGLPYVVVMTVSVIMYKRMDISNTDIALYTSWLYLPWVIKFLWSPVVDLLKTKRIWIITMQLFIGAGLGCIAIVLPLPGFFKLSLGFFWLLAFSSATQDIAIDGFYMLGLDQHQQAWFVGIRSIFYRIAMLTGQGLLIIFVGNLETTTGLNAVEIDVLSVKEENTFQWIDPDSVKFNKNHDNISILVYPDTLKIAIANRTSKEKELLVNMVKIWNKRHGFIKDNGSEKLPVNEISEIKKASQSCISSWLDQNFGHKQQAPPSDKTGNFGIIYFKLSQQPKPAEDIDFHFGWSGGDKSINFLTESWANRGKIRFNHKNWDKPALAVIQLDSKLEMETIAAFSGRSGNIPLAWSITFSLLAILFIIFFLYHLKILPYPESDKPNMVANTGIFIKEFWKTFKSFFVKANIIPAIFFLLLYRLAESQLVKLASPFLLDSREVGGLALTTGQVGFVYGTVGLTGLVIGGILGGFAAARHGLRLWLWPMALAINLPNVVYIYLSAVLPDSFFVINLCVAIEQFGYGFGFTAYMLYMIYISQGEHKTSHFAITTAFMALGMMLPGMFSGWLQEIIGYYNFFIWVMISTIPSFLILFFLKIDKGFGRKIS